MSFDAAHRPFRYLTVATLAVGLFPVAFWLSAREPATLGGAYFAWGLSAYLWAAVGTLLAGTTFDRGDPQRPGWLLLAASYALLVLSRLLAGPQAEGLWEGPGVRLAVPVSVISILSAFLGVAGFLLLARAWRDSGLDLTSRATRVAMRLAGLAVALVAAGPDLVEQFPKATQGDPIAIVDVVTDLLDGALFVVAVPVLRAALALGGGVVVWPWVLLNLSLIAWLGYDASAVWGETLGLSPLAARVVQEATRSVGALAAFAAGVAQRWIMQAPPGGERTDRLPLA